MIRLQLRDESCKTQFRSVSERGKMNMNFSGISSSFSVLISFAALVLLNMI